MKLATPVATSRLVSENSRRLAKIGHLADFIQRLDGPEVAIGVPYLVGELRQGIVLSRDLFVDFLDVGTVLIQRLRP